MQYVVALGLFVSMVACGSSNGGGGNGGDTDVTDDDDQTSCVTGALRCGVANAQQVEVCQADGNWTLSTTCPTGTTCTDGQCTGAGPCTAGTYRCASDGASVEVCQNDGSWQISGRCDTNICVGAGQCAGECTPGTQACCTRDAAGVLTCETPKISVTQVCTGGRDCEAPAAIYVGTCSSQGIWTLVGCQNCLESMYVNYATCGQCRTAEDNAVKCGVTENSCELSCAGE